MLDAEGMEDEDLGPLSRHSLAGRRGQSRRRQLLPRTVEAEVQEGPRSAEATSRCSYNSVELPYTPASK